MSATAGNVSEVRNCSDGEHVFGTFRVHSVQISNQEMTPNRVALADATGTLPATIENEVPGSESLRSGVAFVEGTMRGQKGTRRLEIQRINYLKPEQDGYYPLWLIPIDGCAVAAKPCLKQLIEISAQIHRFELANFLDEVFSDPAFYGPYFTMPASGDTHHNFPGGNAVHCLEAANLFLDLAKGRFRKIEVMMGVIATLLHDAGKVRMHHSAFTLRSVNHDTRTLEALAGPLANLHRAWPQGAELMRFLLLRDDAHCRLQSSLRACVRFADVLSATQDGEKRAFAMIDSWGMFACIENKGFKRSYIRCPSVVEDNDISDELE